MSLSDAFAPEGHLDPDLRLGTPVRVRARLAEHQEPKTVWYRGWRRKAFSARGVVVGLRFPYSGRFWPGAGAWMDGPPEPPERHRDRTHRAYLVAYDMRKAPVYVLAQDLVILE